MQRLPIIHYASLKRDTLDEAHFWDGKFYCKCANKNNELINYEWQATKKTIKMSCHAQNLHVLMP